VVGRPPKRQVLWAISIVAIVLLLVSIGGVLLWGVLSDYMQPKTPTDKKDLLNVFVVIAAGVVGTLTAIAAVGNLIISRKNLQQQRDLDGQRAQDAALQSYFDQLGRLLTDHELTQTNNPGIRQLASSRTLTLLASLDRHRKGALVRFLHGAGLISRNHPVAGLSDADLRDADLRDAVLSNAYFWRADLTRADLRGANLIHAQLDDSILIDADLSHARLVNPAGLYEADLVDADLSHADLTNAEVTEEQLAKCKSLEGTTMPNGQKYKDWLQTPKGQDWRNKYKKSRGEDGENSGPA
jgi:uncharacterized protein YjbI with pentapeptide repeats